MATVNSRRYFLTGLAALLAAPAVAQASIESKGINIHMDFSGCDASNEERDALTAQLSKEMERVISFLGKRNLTAIGKDITVKVTEKDGCMSTLGGSRHPLLCVPISMYRMKIVPTAHELTHILAWNGFSDFNTFLSEGMACYVQNKMGKFFTYPEFGRSFDLLMFNKAEFTYAQKSPPSIKDASYIMNNDGKGIGDYVNKRTVAYLMAGSFAKYLVEYRMTGRIDDIMRLYYKCSAIDDWKRMTGLDFSMEEKAWLNYARVAADIWQPPK